jgi:phage terminase large subunit GpA-like protein
MFDWLKRAWDFKPRVLLKPSDWQEQYRISPPGSPRPGKWRNYPYQIEPADSILDESVSTVVMQWASQVVGKSAVIEGVLMWTIDQDPSTSMVVFPTTDNAKAWSKNRFNGLIESCATLARLIDRRLKGKSKKSGYGNNTVTHKHYPGGMTLMVGANSPANLRAHTVKRIFFDEVDGYPKSADKEGDPIILAEQRTEKYSDAFSIKTSTPTFKGFSRIESELEKSDHRKWHVKCPRCPHPEPWVIMWEDIKWPKSKDASGKTIHLVDKAFLQCPRCGAEFNDDERQQMVESAKLDGYGWIPTNPAPALGVRGYWANAFIALGPVKRPFKSWMHRWAHRFFDAQREGVHGEITFQNLVLAETYESEHTAPPVAEVLYNRRDLYKETGETDEFGNPEIIIPNGALMMVCGADVQLDRIEAEIVAYGMYEEAWGVCYKVFRGNTEDPHLWNEFDNWTRRQWKHESGHLMWPACVMVDSGNKPKPVYDYSYRCAPRQVYAIKGDRGFVSNWCRRSTSKNQRLFIAKVDGAKENLYANLKKTELGPGYQHYPMNPQCGYDLTYFQQLCAERMVGNYIKGRWAPYFEPWPAGSRNEALDCRVYAMGAKAIQDINWPAVIKSLQEAPVSDWRPKVPEPEKPKEILCQPPTTPLPRQSFIQRQPGSGWSKPF